MKTVEHGTAETEGLLVINHGHQEEDEGGPGRDRGRGHGQELLLVVVTAPDDLGEGVDGLGQDIGRDPACQEDGGQQGQHPASAD